MDKIHEFEIYGDFPAFITPATHLDQSSTLNFLISHKDTIHALLLKHGALVFRGFPVANAKDFSNFIKSLQLGNFVNYIGGDSPRDLVEGQVYTSTEAPPSLHIPLHQELSFVKNSPKHIYFYCEIAPQKDGETIIADARQVYKKLDPLLKERFEHRGLTYVSHYYHKSKIMEFINRFQRSHKSWTEVFETESKDEVEEKCKLNEFIFRWFQNDWLQIKQHRPAALEHPLTKERVWFNQAHLYDFNPRLLGLHRYLAAKLFYMRPETRLHEIYFSDGGPVARKDLYHILDVLEQNTVKFPWHAGDVMVLDNILAMHGRAPFQGKRRVLTALTG